MTVSSLGVSLPAQVAPKAFTTLTLFGERLVDLPGDLDCDRDEYRVAPLDLEVALDCLPLLKQAEVSCPFCWQLLQNSLSQLTLQLLWP